MVELRFEVELTGGAEDDIHKIHAYHLKTLSANDANVFLDEFDRAIGTLEQFPLGGAIPSELERLGIDAFRQILLGPYRIIYRTVATTVFILVVADGRRDMNSLLERRLLRGA